MKPYLVFLIGLLSLSGCGDSSKREAEIVKLVGREQGSTTLPQDKAFIIFEANGYHFLALHGETSPVFIMLNPRAHPWYKQTPRAEMYSFKLADLRQILAATGVINDTVLEVLHSHVLDK